MASPLTPPNRPSMAPPDDRESPAKLNLQRVFEQSSTGPSKQDGSKQQGVPQGPPSTTKGRPRLLLMGQSRYGHRDSRYIVSWTMLADDSRRSGKSSISSVVFQKLPPSETLYLESTARIQKDQMAYVLIFGVVVFVVTARILTSSWTGHSWISKFGIFLVR